MLPVHDLPWTSYARWLRERHGAPVRRVAGFDTPFPYTLEHVYMPHADRVLTAIEEVMTW